MNRTGPLALAALAACLVGALYLEYDATRLEDRTLTPQSNASAPPALPADRPGVAPDLRPRIDAILARPLFAASRRPPAGAPAAAAPPVALPRLTAVLVSNRGKTVIFAGNGDAKPVSVPEGGRIGPFVVQSIGAGQAILAGPDGLHVLRPTFVAANGAAVPTAAPPQQPSVLDLLRRQQPAVGIPGLVPPGTTPAPSSQ